MARDRQRAKRRQAERRDARLREGGAGPPSSGDADGGSATRDRQPEPEPQPEPTDSAFDPAAEARLAASAPPPTAGRSDTVVESPPSAPELEEGEEEPRTKRSEGAAPDATRERGKVVAFLIAVWAELQRVQWPDRKTLTTLTGVVLGFVLIAGGYLGLLDAIFSRVIQALLEI